MYFAFGGIRIGQFKKEKKDFWWDYSKESEIKISLEEVLEIMNAKILPFFNSIDTSEKLLKHLNSSETLFENYKAMPGNYKKDINLLQLKIAKNIDLKDVIKNNYVKYKMEKIFGVRHNCI